MKILVVCTYIYTVPNKMFAHAAYQRKKRIPRRTHGAPELLAQKTICHSSLPSLPTLRTTSSELISIRSLQASPWLSSALSIDASAKFKHQLQAKDQRYLSAHNDCSAIQTTDGALCIQDGQDTRPRDLCCEPRLRVLSAIEGETESHCTTRLSKRRSASLMDSTLLARLSPSG